MKKAKRSSAILACCVSVALAACGSSHGMPGAGADGVPGSAAEAGIEAGIDAGACATCGPRDAAGVDAADSVAPLDDAGVLDAGPVTCPTSLLSRTVGARRSALPALTWWGAGYTLVLDEVVTEQSFKTNLTFEKTDGTGARLAGPSRILPDDGVSRLWPRVAFSGSEYGIAYLEDVVRRPTFLRTDAALAPIAGAKVSLGTAGATEGSVAVGWSQHTWAVAWNEGDSSSAGTLFVQRYDASGAPLAPPQSLGAGWISDNGVPMVPTAAGWAIVATGTPARLYELDPRGTVRSVVLPFGAGRASVASSGTQYAVAADSLAGGGTSPGAFVLVQVGGGVVEGSFATLGGTHATLPNVIWTGAEFVVAWSETDTGSAEPLLLATVSPGTNVGAIYGTPFTAQTNAGFAQLVAGSCGWAAVYGTFTKDAFDYLDVHP